MTELRRAPVIAVFGSNRPETLEPAQRIGRAIADRGCILLTGAGGLRRTSDGEPLDETQLTTVKDRAVRGAVPAGRADLAAPWVGVERRAGQPQAPVQDGTGIVLRPGHDHKRNYVEAHVCDGAIALQGERGTRSEVAFCLVLGRPVLLVGGWKPDYDLEDGAKRGKSLGNLCSAVQSVSNDVKEASPWDAAITDACISLTSSDPSLPAIEYHELPNDDPAARLLVDHVIKLIVLSVLPGAFPAAADADGAGQRYDAWLRQIPPLDE